MQNRVGRRGELAFEEMALEHGYVVQRIDQDQKCFKRYRKIFGDNVKRNDYIIMNLLNIEVDVKCLSLYKNKEFDYFSLEVSEIDKHKKYILATKRRIIFAIFE